MELKYHWQAKHNYIKHFLKDEIFKYPEVPPEWDHLQVTGTYIFSKGGDIIRVFIIGGEGPLLSF